jgi:hypothetical protein
MARTYDEIHADVTAEFESTRDGVDDWAAYYDRLAALFREGSKLAHAERLPSLPLLAMALLADEYDRKAAHSRITGTGPAPTGR